LEFQKTVLRRRMVRHFAKDAVPDRAVNRILELAQHYPSAGFSQGVAYVVVKDPEVRKKIGHVQEEEEYVSMGFHPFISEAPVLIVVSVSEQHYHRRYQESDKLQPSGTTVLVLRRRSSLNDNPASGNRYGLRRRLRRSLKCPRDEGSAEYSGRIPSCRNHLHRQTATR